MNTDLAERIKKIFIQETEEQLSELDVQLYKFEDAAKKNETDYQSLDQLFRILHSMKAGAGTVGYMNAMDFIHTIETVLDKIRSKELAIDSKIVTILCEAINIIHQDISTCIASNKDIDGGKNKKLISEINNLSNIEEPHSHQKHEEKKHFYQIVWRPSGDILRLANDPIIFFKELEEHCKFISVVCSSNRIPVVNNITHDELYLSWEIIINTSKSINDIKSIFIFIQHEGELLIEDVTSTFTSDGAKKTYTDKRIGEILVEKGKVQEKDILSIEKTKEKLGDILVQEKKISQIDLQKALAEQELAKKNVSSTVRVDISKLDSLVNLIGELVISQSKIQTLATHIDKNDIRRSVLSACEDLTRLIGALQDKIMTTRMVPVDTLFSQFHRTIRDLSAQQGKNIRLVLTGQETELDKNIIEKISNPLKHLVRNAIDHGIELPQDRVQLNKPEEAIIQLKAYQKEGSIFIEITDDGKGLDKDKILNKIREKKLISDETNLVEEEIFNYIFLPGFSTASNITDISGRGVGMDVVKKAVDELKGRIDIKTEKDKGTSFIIKLPLTLAIIDGLSVKVGKEVFIIPLLSIDQTFQPSQKQLNTIEGSGEFIDVRSTAVPLIRLHKIFKIKDAIEKPEKALLLNINVNRKNYSIMVDQIVGQQQIVIKNFEHNLGKVLGFSSATILGNGNVAAIIEPSEIIELHKNFKYREA